MSHRRYYLLPFPCLVLWLFIVTSCAPSSTDFTLYLRSRDATRVQPLAIYLDTTAIATLDLAPNDVEERYNTFCCFPRGRARTIKVVVNDTLVVQRFLAPGSWSKVIITVASSERRRDYNDPAVPVYLYRAGRRTAYNLTQAVDSLYDNGLLPEKMVQLPTDSIVHISFR